MGYTLTPRYLGHIFWESEKELDSMQYFSFHENAEQAQHCYLMAIKVVSDRSILCNYLLIIIRLAIYGTKEICNGSIFIL